MERVIDIEPVLKCSEREEEKERLFEELDELFWSNPEVYHELCDFCCTQMRSVSQKAFEELRRRGLLERRDEIPSLTNEVVYESTHGKEPFWQD